ncbi:MAG: hypothetical protein Q9M35_00505 [Rhodothermus sp.]|nr:hypothetical protein [Rhodothermus sp.]
MQKGLMGAIRSGRYLLSIALLAVSLPLATTRAQQAEEYKRVFNQALEDARAKQYQKAQEGFLRAAEMAKAANDQEVAQRALRIVAQLDYNFGLRAYRNKSYDQALEHYTKGIEHDPSYPKNYLGKGLALLKLDRFEEGLETLKQALSVSKEARDRQTQQAAEKAIRDHYLYLASSTLARQGGNPTPPDAREAIRYLDELLQIEDVSPDADVYYYYAEAWKTLGEYQKAVEMAQKALELHRGSRTDKAKIYFVMGEAYMLMGDKENARRAFSNALYGSYKAPAEHYLSQLSSSR